MALEKQMDLFQEGGMIDEGGTTDPVSGNDVPTGSLKKKSATIFLPNLARVNLHNKQQKMQAAFGMQGLEGILVLELVLKKCNVCLPLVKLLTCSMKNVRL